MPTRTTPPATSPWFKRLAVWATSKAGIIFWTCLPLLAISTFAAYHLHPYTSDDVIWQNALLTWRPFHSNLYYSDATASYIAKVPLYWLLGHIFGPTRRALFAAGFLFAVGNFILFYWSVMYFWRKWGIRHTWGNLLSIVWLACLGYEVSSLFIADNVHNIEVGFIFITFMIAAKVYYREFKPFSSVRNIILSILASGILGAMIVDDHYVVYFCVIPLGLFIVYSWLTKVASNRACAELIGLLLMSAAWTKVVDKVVIASGIRFIPALNGNFVTAKALGSNTLTALQGLFVMFGGDFWGRPVTSLTTFPVIVNAAVLVALLCCMGYSVHHKLTGAKRMYVGPAFFVSLFIFVFALYVLSGFAIDTSTYRYFIIAPFIAALLFPLLYPLLNRRAAYALQILLVLSAFCGLYSSVAGFKIPDVVAEPYSNVDRTNSQNYALIKFIESQGVTKGYANYWEANINSYLSGGKLDVLPVVCTGQNQVDRDDWLVNRNAFTKPAAKSFYIYDPARPVPTCDQQITEQFGPPARAVRYNGMTLLIYNYDITSKIIVPTVIP